MEARIFRDQHTETYHYDRPMFAIPPEHWTRIVDALQPAYQDLFLAKWAGLGLLWITANDGRTMHLELYETSEELGAFSVDRVYYRGGKVEQLRQVLYEAQAASSPVDPEKK